MSCTFYLPFLTTLCNNPWALGHAIGKLLYHIAPLISTHLDNAVDFQSPVPRALSDMNGFVESLDAYVAHLRLTDGCSEKFSTTTLSCSDRKAKAAQRKYVDRLTYLAEATFKKYIMEIFGSVFRTWTKEQTRMFNKGVDKAVSGVQWVVYPGSNVVFGAGEGDWGVWLRNACEELGIEEVRAGRRALESM
ncbi:hypothetical protein BDU57DRAFT_445993 [Ampelomyces quisqualis]|uniref:Uncharacterized protein n=1 Tax=Ampelomyces quisqualis TaxID=50730 RepID=A0A6A5QSM5_AMPQU|nr:hypothetical protein BDU57DRAFT_445993 [Ampelomyces quisqualis]